MSLEIGCIADDFTGATDLANMLVRGGLRTVQINGVADSQQHDDWLAKARPQAIVVALKSRTCPPGEAVRDSLASLKWLQAWGARRIYFKVCSTFDSTPQGNIGPVAEALADALNARVVPVCPVFPETGRTLYLGHLFVGRQLLSESSLATHPLTPMTDANLLRVLQAQSRSKVGLIDLPVVRQGAAALAKALGEAAEREQRLMIVDSIAESDLDALAEASLPLPLVVAGSGLGLAMARLLSAGAGQGAPAARRLGKTALISGSCSVMSNQQVRRWRDQGGSVVTVDPLALNRGEQTVTSLLMQGLALPGPVLWAATAEPDTVAQVQQALSPEKAGHLVEQALAAIATDLVRQHGIRTLVVAGGETSGAVVQALGVQMLEIGPQIAPGVPWTRGPSALVQQDLMLALKSGNFGGPDFFRDALALLETA
jgi:uncharacterized protein YgbK (DUF1537 family)